MTAQHWIMVQVPLPDGVSWLDLAKCLDMDSALHITRALLAAADGPTRIQLVLVPAPSAPSGVF